MSFRFLKIIKKVNKKIRILGLREKFYLYEHGTNKIEKL
jgi:hypothetical protein